MSIIIFV